MNIRELEEYALRNNGFETAGFGDGKSFFAACEKQLPELVLLDIMLPEEDGLQVLKKLRADPATRRTPVLMLTARTAISDKVTGLNAGADDYMTKPFDNAELLARLNALCRHTGEVVMNQLHYSDLTLDLNSAELHTDHDSVQLSKKEFELARLFLSHPQHTLSVDAILSAVWGMDSEVTDNNVMAYVSFLRKKLKYLNSNVTIRNIQQIGYRMEATEA